MSLLVVKNLAIRVGNQMISNLHFEIQPGEIWGILGANGSGKTSLLHTLGKLRTYHKGEIFLWDKLISAIPQKEFAKKVGVLLQDTNYFFSQSVFECCMAGRHPHLSSWKSESAFDREVTQKALAQMDLVTYAQRDVITLSGGEKRRLAIATLLTQAPHLYLLDEPLNHLDVYHQIGVLEYFKEIAKKDRVGVVMSLHDVNIAQRFCDKVLMLGSNGDVLQGSTADILTRGNLKDVFNIEWEVRSSLAPYPAAIY